YHGAVGLLIGVDIDIQANISAHDIGELEPYITAMVLEAGMSLADHYQPAKLQVGLAYQHKEASSIYFDARWSDWSKMMLNISHLDWATLEAPFIEVDPDVVVDGNPVSASFRPVWSIRTGGEIVLPRINLTEGKWEKWRYLRVVVRGGFGYDPTPLVSQGDSTALLDTDRFLFTFGAGVEHWDPFKLVDGPVRYDLFFQYHSLVHATLPHDSGEDFTRGYPIDYTALPIGGKILVVGGQFGFDY
ncbi:MAG: hypothetical protein HN348_33910, partial [Proteobacteria bacterium]|nr:hypothetical protein [Pseudomonadota bacterium]